MDWERSRGESTEDIHFDLGGEADHRTPQWVSEQELDVQRRHLQKVQQANAKAAQEFQRNDRRKNWISVRFGRYKPKIFPDIYTERNTPHLRQEAFLDNAAENERVGNTGYNSIGNNVLFR